MQDPKKKLLLRPQIALDAQHLDAVLQVLPVDGVGRADKAANPRYGSGVFINFWEIALAMDHGARQVFAAFYYARIIGCARSTTSW